MRSFFYGRRPVQHHQSSSTPSRLRRRELDIGAVNASEKDDRASMFFGRQRRPGGRKGQR